MGYSEFQYGGENGNIDNDYFKKRLVDYEQYLQLFVLKHEGLEERDYILDELRVVDGELNYANAQEFGHYYEMIKYKKFLSEKEIESKTNKTESSQSHYSIIQIALIYFYEGKRITRENGNQIAKLYGHNSGEKLFQKYSYYSSAQNRKGKPWPETPRKFKNKIALLESVVEALSSNSKQRALDELNTLKATFKDFC